MSAQASIGVALVGYGLAGRSFHAPLLEAVDGLDLRVIATADPGRIAQARADHPAAEVVGGIDDIVDRPDIELVVVATPNRLHAPTAARALAAGQHVVVDKPLAMDVREGEAIVASAAATDRIFCVFQNRRWDGDFLTLQTLIEDGSLGTVDSLESRFERWSPGVDGWRESAIEAGGPLRDLGAHLIDQSLVLFGPVQRVWAQIDRRRPASEVDDSVFVALDHANGVRSRLWMSVIASKAGPRFRVRGLAGEYVKQDLDAQEAQLVGGMRPDARGFGEEPADRWGHFHAGDGSVRAIPTLPGGYIRFYTLLRDAIIGDGPPPTDPNDALQVLRIMEAAERSGRTGAAETSKA